MDAPQTTSADHDLLIEVNTNVKNLASTLNSYTDSNNRITSDHETRLRQLENDNQQLKGAQKAQKTWMAIISFLGGLVSIILGIISFTR